MVSLPEKQGFRGFEQIRNSAAADIKSVLGIYIDSSVKAFEYKPDESLGRLGLLRRIVARSRHEKMFSGKKEEYEEIGLRGIFLQEHNALLVRPNDTFAQYHELGHVYVDGKDRKLLTERANMSAGRGDTAFAKYAFDEGIAQWIAIKTDLGQQEPERHKEGVREHNKLVGKSADDEKLDYDPDIVLEKLEAVKASLIACRESGVTRKGADWGAAQKIYLDALGRIRRQATAVGYVYTESLVQTFKKMPGYTLDKAISLAAQRSPSSLEQMEQEIRGFEGFNL